MKKSLGAATLIFPTPVWCVGTYDQEGKPNVMTAAWAGVCCSNPPCLTVSLRKATYSFASILERGAYTVSVPGIDQVAEADFFGTASGRDLDKFQRTGLTAIRSELVDAPYVGEFPMILECQLLEHFEIGSHTMFVGQILDVKVDADKLDSNGKPDILKVSPLVYATKARGYHQVGDQVAAAYKV